MKLYITAAGRYVGTQAEAKADGKGWTQVEVPTDKAGLIDYLNTLPPAQPSELTTLDDFLEEEGILEEVTENAKRRVAAYEEAPIGLTDVETFIQNADAPALSSVAENVAYRFKEISEAAQLLG